MAIFFLNSYSENYGFLFAVLVNQIIDDVFSCCYSLLLKIAKTTTPPSGTWGRGTRMWAGLKQLHSPFALFFFLVFIHHFAPLSMMSHSLCSIALATRRRQPDFPPGSRRSDDSLVFAALGRTNPRQCAHLHLPSTRNCLFSLHWLEKNLFDVRGL